MQPKPSGCLGCPLYGDGLGFVPDRPLAGADVAVLAQNPGSDEEAGRKIVGWSGRNPVYEPCAPQPVIGRTGAELDKYLGMAGLSRDTVSLHNVLKCRMEAVNARGKAVKTNDLPKGKMLDAAIGHCTTAHLRIPDSVKLVVASGAIAWKAMGGPGRISDWRGFLLEESSPDKLR